MNHAEIETQDDGTIVAVNDEVTLVVVPEEPSENPKAFNRCGIIKDLRTGVTHHTRWLVGELDGVRVYLTGDTIILTKRDLNP